MNAENIIRVWKSDGDEEDPKDQQTPGNPVGEELTDEELQEASGGMMRDTKAGCPTYCWDGDPPGSC